MVKTLKQARQEYLSKPQSRHLSMGIGRPFTDGWRARQPEINELKQTLELVISKCVEAEKIACDLIKKQGIRHE